MLLDKFLKKLRGSLNRRWPSAFIGYCPILESYYSEITPISDSEISTELTRRCDSDSVDAWDVWATKFLRDYRDSDSTDQKALELAIRCTNTATDFQVFLFRLFRSHFLKANARAMEEFIPIFGNSRLIVLHMSCAPRIQSALRSAETFTERDYLRNLIVVGKEQAEGPDYSFNSKENILTVPAPDTYDGLSEKMAAAYRFLGFSGVKACVLKVDDDIRCGEDRFVQEDIIGIANRYHYAGKVNFAKQGMYTWWHFGKCANADANFEPYNAVLQDWANGPAYILGRKSINVLAKSSIYLRQEFVSSYVSYEDAVIAKVLANYGIRPFNYDLLKAGILISLDKRGFGELVQQSIMAYERR
jgi:hypothetical protein